MTHPEVETSGAGEESVVISYGILTAKITPFFELATIMDKKIAKNGKRYCIDEKINRRIHRDRMRTKTGILIFLSVFMTGVVVLLALVIGSIFGIYKP